MKALRLFAVAVLLVCLVGLMSPRPAVAQTPSVSVSMTSEMYVNMYGYITVNVYNGSDQYLHMEVCEPILSRRAPDFVHNPDWLIVDVERWTWTQSMMVAPGEAGTVQWPFHGIASFVDLYDNFRTSTTLLWSYTSAPVVQAPFPAAFRDTRLDIFGVKLHHTVWPF